MNTYTDLANAVTAFAGQEGNPEFASMVGVFVSLGETDVYRNLRHDRMLTSMALGGPAPYLLPDDFLEMSAVNQGYTTCVYVPPDTLLDVEPTTEVPTAWSLFGNEVVFDGVPTAETVISYYARPPDLAVAPNVLFKLNWDLFLYASLAHAMIYLRDEARQAVWDGLFQRKLREIQMASWDARVPKQQPLRVRTA